jgi:hypothetical protein
MIAFGNKVGFVVFNQSVCLTFDAIDSFTANDIFRRLVSKLLFLLLRHRSRKR